MIFKEKTTDILAFCPDIGDGIDDTKNDPSFQMNRFDQCRPLFNGMVETQNFASLPRGNHDYSLLQASPFHTNAERAAPIMGATMNTHTSANA